MTISAPPALALALAAAAAGGCWRTAPASVDDPDASAGWAGPDAVGAADLGTEALDEPRNVHATWRGDTGSSLTFSWRTLRRIGYTPRLWIAPADDGADDGGIAALPMDPELAHTGGGDTYTNEDGVGVEWIVEVTGLEPDTEYAYAVGTWSWFDPTTGPEDARLSPLRRVRTGPPSGSDAPFTFAVGGDTQSGVAVLAAHADEIAETPAAFWLLTGDMTSSSTQLQWNKWFAAAAPLLDAAVVMPVPGNHELSYGTFYGRFALPAEPDLQPGLGEHAWSFDYGNVHVVGLDSTNDADMAPIAAWLDADLAAAAANPAIDWKIVVFHHPAYSSSSHGCTARVLEHWAPIFDAHGVDLAFSGHDHNYERTVPIAGGAQALPGFGVTYIVAGGLFAPLYASGDSWWTAYSESTRSFVVVGVDGPVLHLTAIDPEDQTVIDELLLQKEGG